MMRLILAAILFCVLSCQPFDPNRTPALRGLNVFPHAATPAAIETAVATVIAEADLLCYLETDDPNDVAEQYIAGRFAQSDKPVYVGMQVLPGRDHLERCRAMIALFNPDFFCYATEANDLDEATQSMLPAIYDALKAENPTLPIFVSLQTSMSYDPAEAFSLMEHSDYWAISTYAYMNDGTFRMPPMQTTTPFKPVIISETAWPAEPFVHPQTGAIVGGSPASQTSYVQLLRNLPVKFFVWFVPRDYDDMWENFFSQQQTPNPWALVWKDTGLFDGDGNPRPALGAWRR